MYNESTYLEKIGVIILWVLVSLFITHLQIGDCDSNGKNIDMNLLTQFLNHLDSITYSIKYIEYSPGLPGVRYDIR